MNPRRPAAHATESLVVALIVALVAMLAVWLFVWPAIGAIEHAADQIHKAVVATAGAKKS